MTEIAPVPRDRTGRPLPNTRHKGFNRQILHQELRPGPITNKNILGRYIREWYTPFDVDGSLAAPGELTELDLEDFGTIPPKIKKDLLRLTMDKPVYLYMLKYIHKSTRKPVRIGFLATSGLDHRYLKQWVTYTGSAARYVIPDLKQYLAVIP